ncbi:hypothetical protein L3Q82_015347 [Scortum barcoo]|uniref:Uncharacterized protein n=1 Tax=Scortum barcoo TaxID=214431 RepID=A0ACB8VWS7_9TELE|nr:hypothetical protein L3Q82_015347 [Scortum barcoo]
MNPPRDEASNGKVTAEIIKVFRALKLVSERKSPECQLLSQEPPAEPPEGTNWPEKINISSLPVLFQLLPLCYLSGKEIDLTPGSPLVLTHKIKLVPSGSGSGSGSCGCEGDFAALRERLERLEREVSALREKCGGADGGCCTSKESKGAGCSIKPKVDECPNECSDQGRCVDGKCVCFPGFSGPDCSESNCPGNCNDKGRCVNGQCVCDPGFTGPDCSQTGCPDNCNNRGRCVDGSVGFTGADCSENSCPGNCNNRGRCINGQCVCNPGFTGPDCSKRACPDNCNNRGSGFTGDDCSEDSCPGNCNNRGRCVNGQCVCNEGFTGADCSEKACPNNCSNRGKCVNGKCVCDVGFASPDCSTKGCPNNCNNKGRCVKGKCVCRRGFTGPDCSQCEEGMTGPNCNTLTSDPWVFYGLLFISIPVILVVPALGSDLHVRSFPVEYSGHHGDDCHSGLDSTSRPVRHLLHHLHQPGTHSSILIRSYVNSPKVAGKMCRAPRFNLFSVCPKQKEMEEITVQVEGSLTSFTQTGLAAGQEYTVSITGEVNGRKGAESTAEFMTLISGPTNLQVVKTTTTSAVVQWEQSQGEIDRYRLTVTPNDGVGRSQEMTVQAGQSSAHIQQLEAGRLYDIVLVAEKGTSRSEPATTQVTPGKTLPRVSMAPLTMQVTPEPEQDVGNRDQEINPMPEAHVLDQQGRREDGSEADSVKNSSIDGPNKASVTARTKPLVSRTMAINGTKPKLAERYTLYKKPNVPGAFRFNITRALPGGRKVGPGPLKKLPAWEKKKAQVVPKKPKPGVPTIRDGTIALTVRDPEVEISSTERRDAKNPVMTSGTDSETNRQSSSEEPTVAVGSKEQPDVGMAGHGNDTAPVSSEPNGTVQSQEKKCMNKVKVTHIRLPLKDKGSGCRGGGKAFVGQTPGSHQDFSETDDTSDLKPSSEETDPSDPLHKLLKDTFDSLNITTFSVHLSNSDISNDAESVRNQILGGLKPLSSFPSSSSSLSTSHSSSAAQSPTAPSSSLPSSSSLSSSVASSSLASSSSTEVPSSSLTDLVSSSPSSLPSLSSSSPSPASSLPTSSPSPASSSSLSSSASVGNYELDIVDDSKIEVKAPVKVTSGEIDEAPTPASSGVEQNEKRMPSERGRSPIRRLLPKGGYMRRPFPNLGPLQNQTRPNMRLLPPPSQPLNPQTDKQKEQVSSTELLASSSPPASKESFPAEDTGPIGEKNEDSVGTSISTTSLSADFNQTLRGSGVPTSHRPTTKDGYIRRPQLYAGRFQNKTRANLRSPQHPYRGPIRKSFPIRKPNGRNGIIVGSQTNQLEKAHTPEITDNQSGEQGVPVPYQGVQIRQSGVQDNEKVISSAQINEHDTTITPQTNTLEEGNNAPVQTTETMEIRTPDLNSDKEGVIAGKSTDDISRGSPTIEQIPSETRQGVPKPATLPKRPSTKGAQMRHYISGSQRRENTKTNNTAKSLFDHKTEGRKSSDSKPLKGSDASSGVTREPLDYVGVTNQTSDGFTLVWDSPEGKYKNFVVTRKEVGKVAEPKQEKGKKDREEDQEDFEKEGGSVGKEPTNQPTKETESEIRSNEDQNRVPKSIFAQVPGTQSSTTTRPLPGTDKTFKTLIPGSARSFQFDNLPPQTEYTVTLLGKGPGLLSRLHKLVISTGPEPPTDIVFSEVTENSLTVSWTKPRTSISGFKVTYTHKEDGEPVSVSVDSADSTLGLSQLSPGSSYEVSVISILGLDESDPIKDTVTTLPNPPTDLRAVNVTDTKALLLWRPALAAIDKYAIVYGSGTGSELRVSVSGNAAEQLLSGLEGSTTYTVTISSQLGSLESSAATTTFTTSRGSGRDVDGPRDLRATNVTPRTALLSWKPPSNTVGGYRLTYQTNGHELKEVSVDAAVTEYNLTRLHPGSKYTVQLQAEGGGGRTSAVISTDFTTGALRFPFPSDCSQELLNGIRTSGVVEIFPQGKVGTPLMVYCDMETDGGGWTVFQRRKDGSVDFFRGWKEYTKGFGDLNGEFWLGLESLHNLTATTKMSLRVDLRDKVESVFAKYSTFEVAKRNYRLTVGGYSGTAGDSLSYHNNRIFTTKDRDPVSFITRCAMSYRGGWWYKNCHEANLNGLYGIDVKHQGVIWTSWRGKDFSIPFTEMKMRPAAFSSPA